MTRRYGYTDKYQMCYVGSKSTIHGYWSESNVNSAHENIFELAPKAVQGGAGLLEGLPISKTFAVHGKEVTGAGSSVHM